MYWVVIEESFFRVCDTGGRMRDLSLDLRALGHYRHFVVMPKVLTYFRRRRPLRLDPAWNRKCSLTLT